MHHFVINAGADRAGEAVVALEAGHRPHRADALFGVGIQFTGGHAGLHQPHDFFEHRGHDPARLAHDADLALRLDLDAAAVVADARTGLRLRGRQQLCEQVHLSGSGRRYFQAINAVRSVAELRQ